MRRFIVLSSLAVMLLSVVSARATLYSFGNINATVPDNNLNGYQNTQTISGFSGPIVDVTVNLTISGGFNGDLYAYVAHNGATSTLLNRVGVSSSSTVGYPDAGFGPDAAQNAFTFDDQAGHDVHFYRNFSFSLNGNGQLTGAWQPDGRGIDPLSAAAAFDTAARTNSLSVFDGMNANGPWVLYIADLSPGGVSTLNNWTLNIVGVPEPTTAALLALAGALVLRRRR